MSDIDNTISVPHLSISSCDCFSDEKKSPVAVKKSFLSYLKKLFGLCSDKSAVAENKPVVKKDLEESVKAVEDQLTVLNSPVPEQHDVVHEESVQESEVIPSEVVVFDAYIDAVCEKTEDIVVSEDTDAVVSEKTDAVSEKTEDTEDAVVAEKTDAVSEKTEDIDAVCEKTEDADDELPCASVLEPEPRVKKRRINRRKISE